MTCVHCKTWKGIRPRGLCTRCHKDVEIRRLYRAKYSLEEDEPTEEEIEMTIEEQYQCLPSWWWDDVINGET